MPGDIGALLRREGLYHSNISTWCKQRDQGALHGLSPRKRGRKTKQAENIIEVQKNLGNPGHASRKEWRYEMMVAVASLSETVGKKTACEALALPRATFYRHRNRKSKGGSNSRFVPPLALRSGGAASCA